MRCYDVLTFIQLLSYDVLLQTHTIEKWDVSQITEIHFIGFSFMLHTIEKHQMYFYYERFGIWRTTIHFRIASFTMSSTTGITCFVICPANMSGWKEEMKSVLEATLEYLSSYVSSFSIFSECITQQYQWQINTILKFRWNQKTSSNDFLNHGQRNHLSVVRELVQWYFGNGGQRANEVDDWNINY